MELEELEVRVDRQGQASSSSPIQLQRTQDVLQTVSNAGEEDDYDEFLETRVKRSTNTNTIFGLGPALRLFRRKANVKSLAAPLLMGGVMSSTQYSSEGDKPAGYIRVAEGRLQRAPVIFSAQRSGVNVVRWDLKSTNVYTRCEKKKERNGYRQMLMMR